jgi:DNA-binding transcriptional regulator YiaG
MKAKAKRISTERRSSKLRPDRLRKAGKQMVPPGGHANGSGIGRAATPDSRSIREGFGLSRKLFARMSGFSERAIADWESGKRQKELVRQRLAEMRRLLNGMASVMHADFIPEWLVRPNQAFSGLKPLEVIERGEVDRIWRMIYELEAGVPT